MKKCIVFILFLSLSVGVIAQNDYEPGYYLNSANQKVTGLVKNEDWKASPSSIQFKKALQSERQTISLAQMNGFGINGGDSFIKRTFDLDVSTDNLNNLTYSKEPVFETRTGLLKELVSGTANLYYYEKEGIKEYFYSKRESKIVPLVYVRYLVGNQVTGNNRYKQQLLNAFADCASLDQAEFVNLNYKGNSLVKIFNKYNSCSDADYTTYSESSNKVRFNINVFAGANFSSFKLTNSLAPQNGGDFGSQTGLRFGAELEAMLPFNNNSWAVFTGLARNSAFKSTIVQQLSSNNTPQQNVDLTYSSFNIPLGVRYYINAGADSRIALNLAYVFDVVSEVSLAREFTPNDFDNSSGTQGLLVVGAGFNYKQFFVRGNLELGKDPFKANSSFYESEVSSVNLVLGYQISLSK